MPMPIISVPDIDPAWRAAFPATLATLTDDANAQHGDLHRYADCLRGSRTLTAEQSVAVELVHSLFSNRPDDDPAHVLEGWEIPNGVYIVRSNEGEEFRYNVHLVKEGDLEGKRVLKRYVQGRYKGFAYITRTGGFRMWRRFENDTDQDYVRVAEWLFTKLRFIGRERIMSDRSFRYTYDGRTIEFVARCFNCNTSDVVHGPSGTCESAECQEAHPLIAIEAPPRSDWDREILQEQARQAQEAREARLRAQREQMAQEQAQRAAERLQRARENLLRSEITPAEIR